MRLLSSLRYASSRSESPGLQKMVVDSFLSTAQLCESTIFVKCSNTFHVLIYMHLFCPQCYEC